MEEKMVKGKYWSSSIHEKLNGPRIEANPTSPTIGKGHCLHEQ